MVIFAAPAMIALRAKKKIAAIHSKLCLHCFRKGSYTKRENDTQWHKMFSLARF